MAGIFNETTGTVGPEFVPPPLGPLDTTATIPRTDGGTVGVQNGTGSVSNTTSKGVGASTNFSLASFESVILTDIAKLFSNQLVVLAVLLVGGYFAWKHFHKRR
jgi:hypothetical protein